jgi:hypothetical protein
VHFIAGCTPPRLISLDPIDISGYTVVTVPAVGNELNEHLAALEHNRKMAAAKAENDRRKALLIDHQTRSATALAAALDAALQPKRQFHTFTALTSAKGASRHSRVVDAWD